MKHRLSIYEDAGGQPPKALRVTCVEGDTVDEARAAARTAVESITGRAPRSISSTVDGGFAAVVAKR